MQITEYRSLCSARGVAACHCAAACTAVARRCLRNTDLVGRLDEVRRRAPGCRCHSCKSMTVPGCSRCGRDLCAGAHSYLCATVIRPEARAHTVCTAIEVLLNGRCAVSTFLGAPPAINTTLRSVPTRNRSRASHTAVNPGMTIGHISVWILPVALS